MNYGHVYEVKFEQPTHQVSNFVPILPIPELRVVAKDVKDAFDKAYSIVNSAPIVSITQIVSGVNY